jgi:UDP-glucose 4-epimerase
MKAYIVTGAAGFIGSELARRLIGRGHRVVSVDNLSTGNRGNVPDRVEFYEADCQAPDVYDRIPHIPYDAIFHLAGQSSGEISFDSPTSDLESNTASTLCLLNFARKIGCKRFIYASTMSVYGLKPDKPVTEGEELRPDSFYGVSKLASEHYLRLFQRYGIGSTSLRLFNVYGPGQNMENLRQGMVSIYMAQMLSSAFIHVKGSPYRFRDFVYIDDVADAFLSCLETDNAIGKSINIGTGTRTEVQDLLGRMIRIFGRPVECKFEGSTPGDSPGIFADIALAAHTLNYRPKTGLDEGLSKMMAWASENIK